MNYQNIQLFVLIIPASLLLLGIAFIICQLILREQTFLAWVANGYILTALALAAQSLMSNQQLSHWAVITGTFYLFGIWSIAHGMALRKGSHAHPVMGVLIGLITLSLLFYFSWIAENLWLRIIILSLGMGAMQLLVAKHFLTQYPDGDMFDRALSIAYISIIIYTLVRPIVIFFFSSPDNFGELTKSNYWLLMLSASILLSLWLALVIFAITVRDIVLKLNDERYRDPLTHLLNRRGFFEEAKKLLGSHTDSYYFLLTCDIDHFKHVNDNWGHLAGDKVLQAVSKAIVKNVRKGDLVARFGGEEFVVFLRGMDIADARKIAERIREEIEQTTFNSISTRVTASFGLADIAASDDLVSAIGRADARLYNAKQNGRNQVCWNE